MADIEDEVRAARLQERWRRLDLFLAAIGAEIAGPLSAAMERMGLLDAEFWDLEDEHVALHIGGIAVFDGPVPSAEELRDRYLERLGSLPRLRQRMRGTPFGLTRPRWSDDRDFDLTYHLHWATIPNPGTPVLDSRAKGIKDALAQQAPGVRVLGPFQTYSDPAQNYGAWQAQVNAHPDALAFLGVGDADSYNLARLKEQRHGGYLTAGFDVDPKTLDAIKRGTNFSGIDPEHYLKGYIATALLIKAVRDGKGKPPSGWFKTPGLVMDSGNIDEIVKRQQSVRNAYAWYKPQLDRLLADPNASIRPLKEAR